CRGSDSTLRDGIPAGFRARSPRVLVEISTGLHRAVRPCLLPPGCCRALTRWTPPVLIDHYQLVIILVRDRKSTRLNSSHVKISYAVFCLKKKKRRYT